MCIKLSSKKLSSQKLSSQRPEARSQEKYKYKHKVPSVAETPHEKKVNFLAVKVDPFNVNENSCTASANSCTVALFHRKVSVIILLFLFIFLFLFSLITFQPISSAYAQTIPDFPLESPIISNINYSQFTVIWITTTESVGTIHYGKTAEPATEPWTIAYDVRGPAISTKIHYVTISSLVDPGTLYYFDLINDTAIDDNQGAHYTCATAPIPSSPLPMPDNRYDKVVLQDGSPAGTPAVQSVVFIRLQDNNQTGSSGYSTILSSLVEESGWWCVSLSNAWDAALSNPFSYSGTGGDTIQIMAVALDDQQTEMAAGMALDTSTNPPFPDMVLNYIPEELCVDMPLNQGWNLISIPVSPDNPTAANLFPDAVVIYEFDPSSGYLPLGADSTLEVGRGYWINILEARTYRICGQEVTSHSEELGQGWSLIGGISCLCNIESSPGDIVVLYSFDPLSGYLPLGSPPTLVPGLGYWINLSQASTITMECPSSASPKLRR